MDILLCGWDTKPVHHIRGMSLPSTTPGVTKGRRRSNAPPLPDYSQDNKGNVWYFGEDTAELEADGTMVSTEGTWHTAEAGAQPGIFMPASPRVGESHRQEYYRGHAEDVFQVLDLTASVSVPYKSFSGTLQTKEWTPLEPDVRDNKYYVQGIGEVKETTVKGPREELVLVDVKND